MNMIARIIVGILSAILEVYAIREIIQNADDLKVMILAGGLLFIAICGMVDALRKH